MRVPDGSVLDRVELITGARPVSWTPVDRGYAPTERWVMRLDDDGSVFVKVGTNAHTAGALRAESAALTYLGARHYAPALIGFADHDARPLIVLEDLSEARWPPPWDAAEIEAVLEALKEVSATTPPDGTGRATHDLREALRAWREVEADPSHFLSLQMASERWLRSALPALLDADERAPVDGDALLHLDVRSDNICIRDGRATLVDWNWISVGNPALDVAAWLPSLRAEGGPRPEAILDEPLLAGFICGYFAMQAGKPVEKFPGADRIRAIQLAQLRTALPWVVRALDLAPLDGPRAPVD